MPVEFYNDKVLFTPGGNVAMDPNCCCGTPCCVCDLCKFVPCCVTVGFPPLSDAQLNYAIPGVCDNEQFGHDFEGLWWCQCAGNAVPGTKGKILRPPFVPPFVSNAEGERLKSIGAWENFSPSNFAARNFANSAFPGAGRFTVGGETGTGCCSYSGIMEREKLDPHATSPPYSVITGISCYCNGKDETGVILPCYPGSLFVYWCYIVGPDGFPDQLGELALFCIVDLYCNDLDGGTGFARFYSYPLVFTGYEFCTLSTLTVRYWDGWQGTLPPMTGVDWMFDPTFTGIPTYELTVNTIFGTIASCVPLPP